MCNYPIPLQPRPTIDESHFSCPTCRDEGLPARVLAVDEATHTAIALLEGGEQEVALDLLDGVQAGDFILVHLATAIAKLDPGDVMDT